MLGTRLGLAGNGRRIIAEPERDIWESARPAPGSISPCQAAGPSRICEQERRNDTRRLMPLKF